MKELIRYSNAVEIIKTAILHSQAEAAQSVNESQLSLYFAVGGYVSASTRSGAWGTGAIEAISEQLQRELPGLRGFSARNLKYMRAFYEAWSSLLGDIHSDARSIDISAAHNGLPVEEPSVTAIRHLQVPNCRLFQSIEGFTRIGFTHHRVILEMVKNREERLFYIREAAEGHFSIETLKRAIHENDYAHRGLLPNNFMQTLSPSERAFRAVNVFKDEYLLDFINVEELGVRDKDIDERVLEQGIVHDVQAFIMRFGRDFSFIGNQYHLDAFGVDQYIDLLFFNRALNCLVAVELKAGPFKTAYLGQLSGYLSILDKYVRKPHEERSVGIVLCKNANKSFVDFVIRDYNSPMGVATYKTSKDMSQRVIDALPPIDSLQSMLDEVSVS